MQFSNENARLYIPDAAAPAAAVARTTHLGVGAHQDDLEFMAFHGILECYHRSDRWFGGVTCTNGAGSARAGRYAEFSNDEMQEVRLLEQEKAAMIGNYSFMAQLDYPSSVVKDPTNSTLKDDLRSILETARPEVVYTHNPADKHDTHIAVVVPLLQALRELPADQRPKQFVGCEVWRGLDWMMDDEKFVMDVSPHENLAASLNGVFDSQIAGGKRYDLATQGRRYANSTFFDSHSTDDASQIIFGIDLTPLLQDDSLELVPFVLAKIDRFRADVEAKISQRLG